MQDPLGARTAFPGEHPVTFRDIPDGLSNTILVVEFKNSGVHWMEPRDLDLDELVLTLNPAVGQGISSAHAYGAQCLLGDGSVRFFGDKLRPRLVRALLTRNGGEPIGEF